MRSSDRVMLAWIDPGLVDGMFAVCLGQLWQTRSDRLAGMLRVEGSLLSRQRNEVVAAFLAAKPAVEWLLMVDSDEQLSISAFDKMVSAAHAVERPIVSGLVFSTVAAGGVMPQVTVNILRCAGADAADAMFAPILDYPVGQVIEVDACGTGALLVHRSVLEAIAAQASPGEESWCWFRDLPVAGNWLGEDVYFCRLARSLGFKIHAHTGAILPHRRRFWLDERPHERARESIRG